MLIFLSFLARDFEGFGGGGGTSSSSSSSTSMDFVITGFALALEIAYDGEYRALEPAHYGTQ